ncbi:MAG: phosphoglycerate kinase [Candidatus Parcubacteria bacterium]|nr:phosphoglycerate kinase [Candidatus Parcubacteria bacterium]
MRNIKLIKNLKGKTVLVRVDFNVPIVDGKVEDDFRIIKALPTIQFLQKKGAKVVLIAHLGKGGESLALVAKVLNKFIKTKFVPDIIGAEAQNAVKEMKNGEIVLLENLRNDVGEEGCSKLFAVNLAQLADVYVNEAFSVSHRSDASIVLLPKIMPSYAGFQLEEEVKNLSHAFDAKLHPFLFILGGAKFSTKMPVIKKYLKFADYVFIGGALLNDFLKAEGLNVGKSLVDDDTNYGIKELLKNKLARQGGKLILPTDVVVRSEGKLENKKVNHLDKKDNILDVGSESVENLASLIKKAKLIIWNGPLGKYEDGGGMATEKVLKLVAGSKAKSIIGGGDTVSIISEMNMEDKFTFVSTGGGATLDFLVDGTLVGIKALK